MLQLRQNIIWRDIWGEGLGGGGGGAGTLCPNQELESPVCEVEVSRGTCKQVVTRLRGRMKSS